VHSQSPPDFTARINVEKRQCFAGEMTERDVWGLHSSEGTIEELAEMPSGKLRKGLN